MGGRSVYCGCFFGASRTGERRRGLKRVTQGRSDASRNGSAWRAPTLPEDSMKRKKGVPDQNKFGVVPDDEAEEYDIANDDELEDDDDLDDDEFDDDDDDDDDENGFDDDFDDDFEAGDDEDVEDVDTER